jgi:hypothetical protein
MAVNIQNELLLLMNALSCNTDRLKHVMMMSFFKLAAEFLLKKHNSVIVGCYVSVRCVCCLCGQILQCGGQTLKLLACICTNLFLQFYFPLHTGLLLLSEMCDMQSRTMV